GGGRAGVSKDRPTCPRPAAVLSVAWATPRRRGFIMLAIRGRGVTRREVLRVGGLGFTGLLWADWLRARGAAANRSSAPTFGRAKACILIFNYGGPSHLDLWDLKPDAPK